MKILSLALSLFFMAPVSMVFADAASAVKTFKDQQCAKCHSWKSQGIEAKRDACDQAAEDYAECMEDQKKDPVDMSKMSDKVTGDKVAYLVKWLNKEEKREGKAHKKRFKGTPEELKSFAEFLAQQ